ncbi:MAG TPA: AAA family ATPase, partial [Kiloniellales bacterium]|nr:AAA family ATPase [Kiloniellales bacterium]
AAHLAGTLEDAERAARLFAYLLSSPGEYRALLEHDPENVKEAASNAIVQQLTALSRNGPLLLVIEDAQWIDPTSRELLEALADRIQSLRIMIVVTFRLDGPPPLSDNRPATLLKLTRLRPPDCRAIVETLAERKALPANLLDEIMARADGVALYLEEITRAVLESETLIDCGDHWEAAAGTPARIVPTTLKASLASRLDRAPGTREVAQIASVIGREFSRDMLAAVSRLTETAMEDSLSRLVGAGMLQLGGIPPHASYRFRHALVQEAAYESLLHSRLKELHGRVAEVLERQFPEAAATEPALLAHHFEKAGLPEKAIEQYLKAGELALARSAMSEAITVLQSALGLLPALDDEEARRLWELRLQVSLGSAYRATRAPSAAETGQAWDRARALCRDEADAPYLLRALFGQFLYRQGIADLARARQLGQDLLAFGQRHAIPSAIAAAYGAIGRTAFGQGDLGAARTNLEQALAVDAPADDATAGDIQRAESRVLDLCYLSWTLYAQGHSAAALRCARESIELARSLVQSYAKVVALGNACYLHHFRR